MDVNLSTLWKNSEGQGNLACCSPWGHKELDTTEQLNNKGRGKKHFNQFYSFFQEQSHVNIFVCFRGFFLSEQYMIHPFWQTMLQPGGARQSHHPLGGGSAAWG